MGDRMLKDGQMNNQPKSKDSWSQTLEDETELTWVLGIPFCRWSMKQVTDWITSHWDETKLTSQPDMAKYIVTANPEIVMGALENKQLKEALLQADLVTPDGTGIVWAADYLGKPVSERVAGYDLLHAICKTAEDRPFSVYLLGAKEETNQQAAARLAAMYPKLHIVGRHHGYFTDEEEQAIIADINQCQPDLLLVALGFPKQEIWIQKYKAELRVKVAIGVGGSFDVLAGRVKRAPQIWQNLRLEWLYRLLQEPSRIKRQLALPKFVLAVRRHKKMLQNM